MDLKEWNKRIGTHTYVFQSLINRTTIPNSTTATIALVAITTTIMTLHTYLYIY